MVYSLSSADGRAPVFVPGMPYPPSQPVPRCLVHNPQHLALPDADVALACLRPRPRMPVPAGHPGCSLSHRKDVRASVAHPGAVGAAEGRCSRPPLP